MVDINKKINQELLISLLDTQCRELHDLVSIKKWISERNETTTVKIKNICIGEDSFWFYNKKNGRIQNKDNTFFEISGIREVVDLTKIKEQPIYIQKEIGYLGILAKRINGVLHFLMQAKIEPGNINKVQLSPTIQATYSNFTQAHGGNRPKYIEYFINKESYFVVVDELQSEQSSRFFKKRNRNICLLLKDNENIIESETHRWLTLKQIKELLKTDNLVNMDSRTVISCLPVWNYKALMNNSDLDTKHPLIMSACMSNKRVSDVFSKINEYKMFNKSAPTLTRLDELSEWVLADDRIYNKNTYNFDVIFSEIEIEGREVRTWTQPLMRSKGKGLFGLIIKETDSGYKFLIRLTQEIGTFDIVELGPTVQLEYSDIITERYSSLEKYFYNLLENGKSVLYDVILSEEGGRFYHEENRNVIIKAYDEADCPPDYMWLDFWQLNELVKYNNILNIQLRNLLSLLTI